MRRVAITGVDGLLGWHLRCLFHATRAAEIVPIGRRQIETTQTLATALKGVDAVVHFAGMNRGDERVVADTNVALTQRLIDSLRSIGSRAHVLFSSSTHIYRETAYGASKRQCAERLRAWADAAGASFSNVVMPGVFGEAGKPFYNSVVSTMCHQLAHDESPKVMDDNEIELIHAQRVADRLATLIEQPVNGDVRVDGDKLLVSALLRRLTELHQAYASQIVPDVRDPFQLDLFNTYRSYLFPHKYPFGTPLRSDQRGDLFEVVRELNGGQSFMSTTHPGITRGNHYHRRKIERFCVVGGEATIRLRRLFDAKVHVFQVSGKKPVFVDMPTLHTHNITNTGTGELLTLFWANEIFDPTRPDTVGEPVELPEERT